MLKEVSLCHTQIYFDFSESNLYFNCESLISLSKKIARYLVFLYLASEHKDDKGHPSFQKKYILHVMFSGLKMK